MAVGKCVCFFSPGTDLSYCMTVICYSIMKKYASKIAHIRIRAHTKHIHFPAASHSYSLSLSRYSSLSVCLLHTLTRAQHVTNFRFNRNLFQWWNILLRVMFGSYLLNLKQLLSEFQYWCPDALCHVWNFALGKSSR